MESLYTPTQIVDGNAVIPGEFYGYLVTFENGDDDCWFSPQQPAIKRTTYLHILCPPEGVTPPRVIQLEDYLPTRCRYNATMYHPVACQPPTPEEDVCHFPHLNLDLNPIFKDMTLYLDGDAPRHTYRMTMCGPSPDPECRSHNNAAFCQYDTTMNNAFFYNLGGWTSNPKPTARYIPHHANETTRNEGTFVLEFANAGEKNCFISYTEDIERTTTINLRCGATFTSNLIEPRRCHYEVSITHPDLCESEPEPEPEPEPQPDITCVFPDVGLDLYKVFGRNTTLRSSVDGHYAYELTMCGVSPDPSCAAHLDAAFCQYDMTQGNSFVASLGTWNTMIKPVATYHPASENEVNRNNGTFLITLFGAEPTCHISPIHSSTRSTVVALRCGETFSYSNVRETAPCKYEISVIHPNVCEDGPTPPEPEPEPTPEQCYFPNVGVDLRAIFGTNHTVTLNDAWTSQFEYRLTLCGKSPDPTCAERDDSSFCQYDTQDASDPRVNANLGSFLSTPLPTMHYLPSAEAFLDGLYNDDNHNNGTYFLTFNNSNDPCLNRFGEWVMRNTTLMFHCGEEEHYSVITESYSFCEYSATITHPGFCKDAPTPPESVCYWPELGLDLESLFGGQTVTFQDAWTPRIQYNLTFCRPSIDPTCAAHGNSSFCQYDNLKDDFSPLASLARAMGSWTTSPRPTAHYTPHSATEKNRNNGTYTVVMNNTASALCQTRFGQLVTPTVQLDIKCGPAVVIGVVEETLNYCTYIAKLEHPDLCVEDPDDEDSDDDMTPGPCKFPELKLDLNKVFANYSKTIHIRDHTDPSHYVYDFTFCSPSPHPQCGKDGMSACQFDLTRPPEEQHIRSMANWASTPLPNATYHEKNVTNPGNGTYTFVFETGDLCMVDFNTIVPPKTTLHLNCSESGVEITSASEERPCEYTLHIAHPAMCVATDAASTAAMTATPTTTFTLLMLSILASLYMF